MFDKKLTNENPKKNSSLEFIPITISIIAVIISVFTYFQSNEINRMNLLINGINLLNKKETFASGIQFLKRSKTLSNEEKTGILMNSVLYNIEDRDIDLFEEQETAAFLMDLGIKNYKYLFDSNRDCVKTYRATGKSPEYFYCVKNSGKIIMELICIDKSNFISQTNFDGIVNHINGSIIPVINLCHDYSNIDFSDIEISNTTFDYYVDMKNTNWNNTILTNVSFINAQLEGSNFTNSTLYGVSLISAAGMNSSFVNASISNSKFIAGDFRNADFTNANFSNSVLFEDDYCVVGVNSYNDKMISNYISANFKEVKGLTNAQKYCLCISGAVNIPGGCE